MRSNKYPRSRGVDRRHFLIGLTSLASTAIAGCGEVRNDSEEEPPTPQTHSSSTNQNKDLPDEYVNAKEDAGELFDRLNDLPITENQEFVFDVRFFENQFDHQGLRRRAEKIAESVKNLEGNRVPESRSQELIVAAKLGKQLVAQRVMTHQVIAAGLTFEQQLRTDEYGKAVETVGDGREFLRTLETTGERIEDALPEANNSNLSLDGYDPSAIGHSQDVLIDVVHWAKPAYRGLYHVARGLVHFRKGNGALDAERYGTAAVAYGESGSHFEAADEMFNEAQGRGRRLSHVVPLVEGVRCLIPAYLASCDHLEEAMEAFDVGDEDRGQEIAREAFSAAEKRATRCF